MTERRLISVIIAIIVAVAIMYVGKSCAVDIAEKNKKVSDSTYQTQNTYSNSDNNNFAYTQPTTFEQPTTETTTEYVEYVTNLFGEIVGTVEPTTVSENGETETIDENTEPTTRPSILNSEDPTGSAEDTTSILESQTEPPTDMQQITTQQETQPTYQDSSEPKNFIIYVN